MGDVPKSMPAWFKNLKESIVKELRESIDALVEATVRERTKGLEEKVRSQDRVITRLENNIRKGNFEIHGVPEKKGERSEDLAVIVKAVAEKLGTNALAGMTVNVYRKGKPVKLPGGRLIPAPIICETRNVMAVDRVMEKAKMFRTEANRDLSLLDISLGTQREYLIVRRNFCEATQYLLRAAKRIAKEKGYQYVWITAAGLVNARKKEGADKVVIGHQEDLKNL